MPFVPGLASPLVDLFVKGQVPLDVRLLAASGQVAADPAEQVALLAVLTGDPDPTVSTRAWETWRTLPADVVADVLAQHATPEPLRAWVLQHAAANGRGAVVPDVDDARPADVSDTSPAAPDAGADSGVEADTDVTDEAGRLLSSLPVPERIKAAMLGSREQRAALIRDPNRVVSMAVLSSPKLSETEVERFARMTNVATDVLRLIGTNRAWLRNYAVVAALVRNARAPLPITLGLVPRLQERDLKALSLDRNLPEALRLSARKALVTRASRRG